MELPGRLLVLLDNQSFQSLVSLLSLGPNFITDPLTIIVILLKGKQVTWRMVLHFHFLLSSSLSNSTVARISILLAQGEGCSFCFPLLCCAHILFCFAPSYMSITQSSPLRFLPALKLVQPGPSMELFPKGSYQGGARGIQDFLSMF